MKKSIKERFLESIKKTNNCWIWIKGRSSRGYGRISINNKVEYAHRLSYVLYNGGGFPKLCVLHKCDNPPCVNPKHLFLGTHKDNTQDCINKNRRNKTDYGENSVNAKLTEEIVKRIRKEYKSSKQISQQKLANKYKTSRANVYLIVNNKRWKHL